jgi:hypothetical protein
VVFVTDNNQTVCSVPLKSLAQVIPSKVGAAGNGEVRALAFQRRAGHQPDC